LVADDDAVEAVESLEHVPGGVEAVGHRVVHGGSRFREPVFVDRGVEEAIEELSTLAPLHNRPALAAIRSARAALPDVPHVAVFDTAFHSTIPDEAALYPLPRRWADEWGVRRYGFHGLSVRWSAGRVPVRRLVVCHLGGGCSATAVLDGRSVDTTMGFSPLEGLAMATRSGSVDPGVLLYLLRERRLTLGELDGALERKSGLLGLSGRSGDVRELLAADDRWSRVALAVYSHRIAAAVAALAASLEGLDALVFTAGVGEGSPSVRRDVCERLGFIGVSLDETANDSATPDAVVSAQGSAVAIHVVAAREELVIADDVRRLLAGA
jgi:acetate kinase